MQMLVKLDQRRLLFLDEGVEGVRRVEAGGED
jgi:hypothetical protein